MRLLNLESAIPSSSKPFARILAGESAARLTSQPNMCEKAALSRNSYHHKLSSKPSAGCRRIFSLALHWGRKAPSSTRWPRERRKTWERLPYRAACVSLGGGVWFPFLGDGFFRQENEWKWVVCIKTCQKNLKHKRTTQHLWGCLALNFEPMQMVAVCCPETWVFGTASWRYFAMPAMPIMPMCVHRLMSNFRSFELIRSHGAIQRKRPDLIQG